MTAIDKGRLLARPQADRLATIAEMRNAHADLHNLAYDVGVQSRYIDLIESGEFDTEPKA